MTNIMMRLMSAAVLAAGMAAAPTQPVLTHQHTGTVALTAGWTFTPDDPDLENADLIQAPLRSQLEWVVPGTFTDGDQTLVGDLLIRPTGGALHEPDFQFVTPGYDFGPDGAATHPDSTLYAYGSPTGSGYFSPAYYFAPNGAGDATGSAGRIDSPFGTINLNSASSWPVHPADYTHPITYSDILGIDGATHTGVTAIPFTDVLSLGPGGAGNWTADYGAMSPVMYQDMPIWGFSNASFTDGDTTLHGSVYLNSATAALGLYNEQFVATDGAVYSYHQGIFGFDNMYFDPGGSGSAAVDILKTPFGNVDLSWLAWLFTPENYSASTPADAAGVLAGMLEDPTGALSGTIEFGQAAADAAAAL